MRTQPPTIQRLRLSVAGIVQGVGFRPFVHRLATSLQLSGFVRNDGGGVAVEVQGERASLSHFIARLHAEAPALARIERCTIEELSPETNPDFVVRESDNAAGAVAIPPDLATCDACLRELFDPGDRRYRYPFITCTHCGPRYSIVRALPYDRMRTTMAAFPMCEACDREYHDPRDRRFHSQTNACPVCGPTVRLVDASGATIVRRDNDEATPGSNPIDAAAALLNSGGILAVKGIGGYHLACRADNEEAVARLRQRKLRDEKPFALLVPDLRSARELVQLGDDEIRLLGSVARPIVLARKRQHVPIAGNVAPGRAEFGIMLPYSPMHHLLARAVNGTLVLTSGNRSDEPIITDESDAFAQLDGIVDGFLTHNRAIHARCDDSVLRVVDVAGVHQPLMLRRSRGFVPSTVPLAGAIEPMLACGAELKSTVTLAYSGKALVGPHLGDLENFDTLQSFNLTIAHLGTLSGVRPASFVCDPHPDYLSTRYARTRGEQACVYVQHHHAHLAACLAEYGVTGPALGLIFDGSGYGADGTIWGGELLLGDLTDFERMGQLWPVRLPGGAAAVREPWRMACAWLAAAGSPELPPPIAAKIDAERWHAVQHLLDMPELSPITSSMGRLFDAVAALCGVRLFNSYEGQAAGELEAVVRAGLDEAYPFPVLLQPSSPSERPAIEATTGALHSTDTLHRPPEAAIESARQMMFLDARPLVRAVLHDVLADRHCSEIAACAHHGVANAAVTALQLAFEQTGVRTAVLSGGVFQNVLLLERTAALLRNDGWRVLVPRNLPPNDGGISFGQAAAAAARLRRSQTAEEAPNVSGNSRTDSGGGGS